MPLQRSDPCEIRQWSKTGCRPPPSPTQHSQEHTVGGPYAYYVLGVLFVVYIFNFIDRQILAILLQPIKEDLKWLTGKTLVQDLRAKRRL